MTTLLLDPGEAQWWHDHHSRPVTIHLHGREMPMMGYIGRANNHWVTIDRSTLSGGPMYIAIDAITAVILHPESEPTT